MLPLQISEQNHIQINTFYNFLLKIFEFSDSILSPNFLWKTLMFLRSAKTASLDSTTLIFFKRCEGCEWVRLPSVLEWCSFCGVLQFCFVSLGFPSLLRGWSFSSFSFWFSILEYPSVTISMSQRLNTSAPSQTLSTTLSGSSSLIFSSTEKVSKVSLANAMSLEKALKFFLNSTRLMRTAR